MEQVNSKSGDVAVGQAEKNATCVTSEKSLGAQTRTTGCSHGLCICSRGNQRSCLQIKKTFHREISFLASVVASSLGV